MLRDNREAKATTDRDPDRSREFGAACQDLPIRQPGDSSPTFALDWINRRIGADELRKVIRLDVRCFDHPPSGFAHSKLVETARSILDLSDGDTALTGPNQLTCIWGGPNKSLKTPEPSLRAAFELTSASDAFGCLLDCSWETCVDGQWRLTTAPMIGSLRSQSLFVTQAYRDIFGPSLKSRPDVDGSRFGFSDSVLFAVDTKAKSAACGYQSPPAHLGPSEPERTESLQWFEHAARLDGLGDYKGLVMAVAVLEPEIDRTYAARMLDMAPAQLEAPLAGLVEQGVLVEVAEGNNRSRLRFADPVLARTAYDMLSAEVRARLHGRAAELQLRSRSSDTDDSGPAQLPSEELPPLACLGEAAQRAIASGAPGDAIAILKQALAAPVARSEASNDAGLYKALALQLAMAKGNAAEDVYESYHKCFTIAQQQNTGSLDDAFHALWGLQSFHLVRGEIRAAKTMGELLLAKYAADDGGDQALLAHRMQGLTRLLAGEISGAIEHYEFVLAHYDAKKHGQLRFDYGSDQGALSYAHRCWARSISGEGALALDDHDAALSLVERFSHPHTSAHAVSVLALAALARDEPETACIAADSARAVGVQHGFPYWVAWCDVVRTAVEARAAPRSGYRWLRRALQTYCDTGAMQMVPAANALLAETALRDHRPDAARFHVDEGLAFASRNSIALYRPELLRLAAQVRLADGERPEAIGMFETAFKVAAEGRGWAFARNIARDAIDAATGRDQVTWLRHYHDVSNRISAG